jgi:lysophospholipase L1-like esterase
MPTPNVAGAADLPPPLPDAFSPEFPRDPRLPTLWVAGDSTAANCGAAATGWGVPFAQRADPLGINFVNHARDGRSSRTFLTQGFWSNLTLRLKAGDWVLIQFGHNDGGELNDPSRARGVIPTTGTETIQIQNLLTRRPETVRSFGSYLRQMVRETLDHGARPVLLSPTLHNVWVDGTLTRANGPWRELTRTIARETGAAFIDHTALIAEVYVAMGPLAVRELFPGDPIHPNFAGADLNARLVASALRQLPGFPRHLLRDPAP